MSNIGEPTNRAGNTLDLVWTSIEGATAWVEREECMTSDHLLICGTVPFWSLLPKLDKRPVKVTKNKLSQFTQVVARLISPTSVLNSEEEIEVCAQNLSSSLRDDVKAVGRRCNETTGRSALWWTLDFKTAHTAYKAAEISAERDAKRRVLRSIVSSVKREYWKRTDEKKISTTGAFKLVHWT